MIKFMLITNDPKTGKSAFQSGVQRLFVDLEILGKKERQGHLNTVISEHSLADVQTMRNAVPDCELVVRVNPLHDGTSKEVTGAIQAGADLLMLPMFHTANDVDRFSEIVSNRVPIVPLVETAEALQSIGQVAEVEGVSEIFIGLNDLHLSMNLKFMFEPLAMGLIDQAVSALRNRGIPFGFGGIGRIGEGELPAELILAEHIRLGSTCVILSRTFQKSGLRGAQFREEIDKLRVAETQLRGRTLDVMESDRKKVQDAVAKITGKKVP